MVFSVINLSIILYTLPTSSGLCVGYGLPGPSMGLALTGRCSPQSHRYYAPGDSLPCRLYATRIILAIYSIMMIIAPSQIITIIN
ncbi:hypothetical protein EPW98_21150, partial [Salmonella enterica]|nr:hypothetical protein [Salmonella enterica]